MSVAGRADRLRTAARACAGRWQGEAARMNRAHSGKKHKELEIGFVKFAIGELISLCTN